MRPIKCYLLVFIGWLWLAGAPAFAQETRQNSIESMTVVQQGSVLNVKLTFKEPLSALPQGFSVASPARIALDFVNTTNGLAKRVRSITRAISGAPTSFRPKVAPAWS